jgi:hypothetical protein
MRFNYKKDSQSELWIVVDGHANDNRVSSHRSLTGAIIRRFECEDLWHQHLLKNPYPMRAVNE